MTHLSHSEILLYGGLALMAAAALLAVVFMIIYICTGRNLKKRLEEEYGKPE